MPATESTPRSFECPRCRTLIPPENLYCAFCGAERKEASPAVELHGINYLLAELAGWEAQRILNSQQAATLRQTYEGRAGELRAELSDNSQSAQVTHAAPIAAPSPNTRKQTSSKRSLFENLSGQHTLRLFLYTGAAMLVVGVVIWLRDVLYLKLQEPVVQAALLAFGTLAATASGWYAILRTRQRLTGRALTLIGSLLVPVNFWFLVRSGLISNNGRAWVVCAFCALLYAHTAALLREKLYVYLASAASIGTLWAIVYRFDREAFGLYALALMIASLVLLHLSRLLPLSEKINEDASLEENGDAHEPLSYANRWGRELWGAPFARVAIAGAGFAALCYMPLRLAESSPSIYEGVFRLRANAYDPGVALLLYACAAYTVWYAGRYIYIARRVLLYTCCALAFCWMEVLLLDGARVSLSVSLLFLSLTALALSVIARATQDEPLARAIYNAGVLTSMALAFVLLIISMLAEDARALTYAAALFALAVAFAVQSTPRFCKRFAQGLLAYAAMTMLAALFALHVSERWFAALFMLALFPAFFAASRMTFEQNEAWIKRFAFDAAGAVTLIAFGAALLQAAAHFNRGDALLLAPCVAAAEISLLAFTASALLKNASSANYFRAGLAAGVLAFVLACLRAGFDPVSDVQIYTTPIAVALLIVAYTLVRRERRRASAPTLENAMTRDASLLLWMGSLLLCTPLCLRAFDARLIQDVAAPLRDVAALCAALALLLFGTMNRLRAPAGVGIAALIAELLLIALTTVDWAQVPLKIYLVTTGALIVFVCWCLEFRREQLLLVRQRIHDQRTAARERFGEWR
ncbi:MAG: SCO7613 C-terminal domain-containing membrane protein [Pyrinomonadaceae bacterium]